MTTTIEAAAPTTGAEVLSLLDRAEHEEAAAYEASKPDPLPSTTPARERLERLKQESLTMPAAKAVILPTGPEGGRETWFVLRTDYAEHIHVTVLMNHRDTVAGRLGVLFYELLRTDESGAQPYFESVEQAAEFVEQVAAEEDVRLLYAAIQDTQGMPLVPTEPVPELKPVKKLNALGQMALSAQRQEHVQEGEK